MIPNSKYVMWKTVNIKKKQKTKNTAMYCIINPPFGVNIVTRVVK